MPTRLPPPCARQMRRSACRPRMSRCWGTLPTHRTVTAFQVTPVIARVTAPFVARPEPGEVEEIFRVPLSHVLDRRNYSIQSRRWQNSMRHYFTVPWGPYYIWGATARMLRVLAEAVEVGQ